jgi:hypothetical protein
MHTLEIAGQPIAIMSGTKNEAEELFNEEDFRSDLIVLGIVHETRRVDQMAKFVVRKSLPEEDFVFEKDFARALAAGETAAADKKCYSAFLIQVGEMLG